METKKQKANKDFLPYVVVVVASYLLAVNLSAAIMVPFSQEAVSSFQEIELDSSSVASREADASQVNRIAQGADHLVAELLLVLLPIVFFLWLECSLRCGFIRSVSDANFGSCRLEAKRNTWCVGRVGADERIGVGSSNCMGGSYRYSCSAC